METKPLLFGLIGFFLGGLVVSLATTFLTPGRSDAILSAMTPEYIAAITALVALSFLTVFQILLICGAPLGQFAWGGRNKKLPLKLRIGSAISILIYSALALFAVSKVPVWPAITNSSVLTVGLWVIVAYLVLGVVLNAFSRSKSERYLMTPVALLLAVCFLIIAMA